MSLTRARKWIIKPFTASGSTVLISGEAGKYTFVKYIIFTVDSGTDIYFCDEDDRVLTCTFQFPHAGAMYALDQLDILNTKGKDFCINSSNAVTGSIMLDVQKVSE